MMIKQWQRLILKLTEIFKDENFLRSLHKLENLVSKILSIALIIVILVSLIDLVAVLSQELFSEPFGFFSKTLIGIFGLFLNVLIALELLENITGYLKKHVIQVELVITTSLIAIARKIIIFDLNKYNSFDLISLGISIFALSISYWLIRLMNKES